MKYTIIINQFVLAKTKLDVVDGAILDYIGFLCGSTNSKVEKERIIDGTKRWTWLDLNTMSRQMPILGIKSIGAFTRRIQKITTAGFIETFHNAHQRLYVRLTPKYDELLIQINSSQAQAVDTNQQSYCSTSTDKDNNDKEEFDKDAASAPTTPSVNAGNQKGSPADKDIIWLTNLSKDDIIKWLKLFPELPEEVIRKEANKAYIWLEERKNGKSKNPNLFLHNWLDRVMERYQNSYVNKRPTVGIQT